ncbi:acetylornithine deacetylase [Pseudomonas sp. nanlin1]|uniref:acetylornithine deacetylase n=1 Tax=Pseudomonas sp. nanlin1 TaxID=3040605 RepID=UPI00388D8569
MTTISRSLEILKRLIGFDTTSKYSNLELIGYVQQLLEGQGIESTLVFDDSGKKANLFASVGPKDVPGVLLSGHTDVVPVAGQAWTVEPFAASVSDGKLYGRGSCDMKGFIAVAIDAMLSAAQLPLQRPLQLALSYDEEIGCVGVRRLLDVLHLAPQRPFLCLVGEPTMMQFALGHKGKAAYKVHCHGQEAHSSLAPLAANAIHLASDVISALRQVQQGLLSHGSRDDAYDIPYSTVHVGRIDGGKALNIVPNLCVLDFEIRHLPADDPQQLLDQLQAQAQAIARQAQKVSGGAAIEIETINTYPGLDTSPTVEAVRLLGAFAAPGTAQLKVAYGTEGGLFAQRLNVPVVVCGPGSIEQAHKPDEYVELSQLQACERFLEGLVGSLR